MLVDTACHPAQVDGGDAHWDRFEACAESSRGTRSDNTERAARADLAIYWAWCAEGGVAALPASAEVVAEFIDAMAQVRAPATVRRYVSSITAAHRTLGLERTMKSEPVQRALKRMHRRKGRRQEQARGLSAVVRAQQSLRALCRLGACPSVR